MTTMAPNWLHLHRGPPQQSPVQKLAEEVLQQAKDLEKVIIKLRNHQGGKNGQAS